MEVLLEHTIMNLKKMYLDAQDKVQEFKRTWNDVHFTNSRERHDINVMAAHIYFYKQCNMDFRALSNFYGSYKINNPDFQNGVKAYIHESYIQ